MDYRSTRNPKPIKSSSGAILEGIAPDGGLFVPLDVPVLKNGEFALLRTMPYAERAAWILSHYLTDFSPSELDEYCAKAYSKFNAPEVTPIKCYNDNTYILELFHGPTCAFKDLALSLLPYLLKSSAEKNGIDDRICVLVATSGDTGKAALESFAGVPGTLISVFYPDDGVSEIQKLQMITQSGENVRVCAVKGNFDDTQSGVKEIFADKAFAQDLGKSKIRLSSANSINWGRLVPQIVYYISAYCDLLNSGNIKGCEKINICVPTGNFGNILSAFYAKKMGLPIDRLICASNYNNVLTDFIGSGVYDANRELYKTASPSMDILISSNVERLLFELLRHDTAALARYLKDLSQSGMYKISGKLKNELNEHFSAGWSNDDETFAEIKKSFEEYTYLPDTHTAVALSVLEKYRKRTGDERKTLVAATASPFKFAPDIYFALTGKCHEPAQQCVKMLSELTEMPVPHQLKGLETREKRFTGSIEKGRMRNAILEMLDL